MVIALRLTKKVIQDPLETTYANTNEMMPTSAAKENHLS
ncbi:hypothetical protein BFV94_0532 [Alteromonas macleodii]|uniref:Uncharacterized protein n=1 Tax=Alteromonas macleodii TaxID=28108 RepID=A0AB36G090_ALTMA|nr:hypothetical protein BFV95_0530 [Alteromonas macleodii]OES34809.1 hypothetical protein BFV94_0532 [Alteromonas macleodii]OES41658.1 hypothetical protein BFV96_0532 [Alteromonas macleodii]